MTCTTHHHACECRERQFQELREYALRLEHSVRRYLNHSESIRGPYIDDSPMMTQARAALAGKPEIAL